MLSKIYKMLFLGSEDTSCRIKAGPAKNLNFYLNPSNNLQAIYGLQEREISKPMVQLIRAANTFVDIGAAHGYYSILAASLKESISIISCEYLDEARRLFEKNLSLNHIKSDRIKWVQSFIGTKETSVDQLLQDVKEPVFCKIDVEGAELDVLNSAIKSIEKLRMSFLIETHSLELEKSCIDFLKNKGFDLKIINNAWWRFMLPELRSITHNRWLVATPKKLS